MKPIAVPAIAAPAQPHASSLRSEGENIASSRELGDGAFAPFAFFAFFAPPAAASSTPSGGPTSDHCRAVIAGERGESGERSPLALDASSERR